MTLLKRRIIFLILIIPLIVYILYLSRKIITSFLLAAFLAYGINPLVQFLERKGARRDVAILTIYLTLFLCGALISGIIIPRLIEDLTRLIREWPTLGKQFTQWEQILNDSLSRLPFPEYLSFITTQLAQRGQILLNQVIVDISQGFLDFFSQSLLLLVLVPLLSYYISRDYPRFKKKVYQWLALYFGQHWTQTFLKIDNVLRVYIRGQLFVTLIVGILISIGLSFLHFEAAIFLGLLAGIMNLIPYFGPILGATPIVILALLRSPWDALYVVILFSIVNQIEVLFLAPRIIGGNLGLHPILVVYLVLFGGTIFGLWGMVFAVPFGALFLIILQSIYEISFKQV